MSRLINVEDYRRRAGRRLPKIIFDYLEGGALNERTLRANTEDLQWLRLRLRIMRDVSSADLTSTVLARDAGTIFVHSAWSGTPLRTVAAAAPGAVWAQLSLWKDAGLVRQHIERATEAGLDVLVIAGDVSASSKRERDLHNGFGVAARPTIPSALNAPHKPRWLANSAFGPKVTFGDQSINGKPMNLRQMERFMHEGENDTATWRDIEQVRERHPRAWRNRRRSRRRDRDPHRRRHPPRQRHTQAHGARGRRAWSAAPPSTAWSPAASGSLGDPANPRRGSRDRPGVHRCHPPCRSQSGHGRRGGRLAPC